MASSITTPEGCNPQGGMLGGSTMSGSSTGRLKLDHPFHYSLGLQRYGQTISHPLQASASWSGMQHLKENPANNPNAIEPHNKGPLPAILSSKGRSSGTSDEDESSWKEVTDEHHCEKGKGMSPWQRIKWTNDMVKHLINIVNFVGEDGSADNLDMNKRSVLQKKGKWRSVSNSINERGWYVSPQQCEDKFNDLNKRYKRLTDILGRDTALRVVDDVNLLDSMSNLTAKGKEDVKKILSSKHSFYKEMHSYHKGCKSPMAADFEFQPGMQFGKVGERCDAGIGTASSMQAENVEGANMNVRSEMKDPAFINPHVDSSMGSRDVDRVPSFGCQTERNSQYTDSKHCVIEQNGNKEANVGADVACTTQDASVSAQQLRYRMMQLEELKVSLQAQALEIEWQHYKWQKLNWKKNRELEKMREDNKRMKFEKDQLTYQLKQKELEVECKKSATSMSLFDLLLEKLKAKEQMQGQGYN